MAEASRTDPTWTAKRWALVLAVAGIFAFALFLRGYWLVDEAQIAGDFVLSGNDPYYHKRAVDHIQGTWSTLTFDPMLNYPLGNPNPNPPLYEWSMAIAGAALGPLMGSTDTATWWVVEWSPAVWGALTVIPVFLIGRQLFGTPTGVISAFFLATSTSHITRSALGFADHDAAIMFFITLAFLFYLKSVSRFTGREHWVQDWRDPGSIARGLSSFWDERSVALGYGALAGVALGATALVWKGFPYAVGIIFVYAVLVMLTDHWANRDSTGIFITSVLALSIPPVMAMPYYLLTSGLFGFMKPVLFIVLSLLVAGLVLVPTRDLPFILVFPAFVLGGAAGVAMAFLVVPEVAFSLLYSLVYFRQTTLYTTIAEAQPATFNTAVFSVGPIVYLFALAALLWLAWLSWREPERRDRAFMLVWGAVALFMAHSAVRFLFNATPPLVLLGGWMTWLTIDALRLREMPKAFRQARGSLVESLRRAVTWWQATGAILLALLLVFPTVFLAVDAGMPGTVENDMARDWLVQELREQGMAEEELQAQNVRQLMDTYVQRCLEDEALEDTAENRERCQKGFAFFLQKRMGAFGQGFIAPYWKEGLDWLREWDSDITPPEDRPAFLSWWDYGHWAIYISEHPSVADNFQNGYRMAGAFIASQNETEAIQLMAGRYVKLFERPAYEALIRDAGVPDERVADTYDQLKTREYAPALDLERSMTLLSSMEEATCDLETTDHRCKRIRYFAVDVRLLPFDDPRTPNVEQTSIFYAPITLAEKDPSNYVEVIYTASIQNPYPGPRQGTFQFNNSELDRASANVQLSQQLQVQSQQLAFKRPYFNSMFYRAYVGAVPPQIQQPGTPSVDGSALNQPLTFPRPATDLQHFRLAYINGQLRILEFYRGAVLEGTVVDDAGDPIAGALVEVYDDAGLLIHPTVDERFRNLIQPSDLNVRHDLAVTDANGTYRALAPYSLPEGNVTLRVLVDGVRVDEVHLDISRDEAERGAEIVDPALDIRVRPGNVEGTVFFDRDGDGTYNASIDRTADNVTVTIGNRTSTTDASGAYLVEAVSAGRRTVTVASDTHRPTQQTATVQVAGGETTSHDVALTLREVPTSGDAWHDADGDGNRTAEEVVPQGTRVTFRADPGVSGNTAVNASAIVGEDGTYTVNLKPGDYIVEGQFTDAQSDVWTVSVELEVSAGSDPVTFDLEFTRS